MRAASLLLMLLPVAAQDIPSDVELLKDYKIPAASIIKFGGVDADGKPDFLVFTPNYSAYLNVQ
jgi:hypothetical protein